MSYFENFPTIAYPFVINGKTEMRLVKDIALNVRFKTEILNNISLYDTYDIQDNETIEKIAEKLYGDPNLHWILMLCNQKYDFYNDYPLSDVQLDEFIKQKYGETALNDQHVIFGELHWEDENGNIVDGPAGPLVLPVSNYKYEFDINESKRRIRVISKNLIPQILTEIAESFERYEE